MAQFYERYNLYINHVINNVDNVNSIWKACEKILLYITILRIYFGSLKDPTFRL